MKTIFDLCRWIIWGPLRKALSYLNPKYLFIVEGVFSFIAYHIFIDWRRAISEELVKSFGNEWTADKIKEAVRNSFRVYVGSQLRMFYLSRLNNSNIDSYIPIDGLQHLKDSLAGDKGAIILNPHFGPFMLIMPSLSYRGFRVNQLALQGEPPWGKRKGIERKVYDLKFESIEGKMPAKFINAASGAQSLREVLNALRRNEILLFPSTGRGGSVLQSVKFMGRETLFNPFPFKLALKTRTPLLPAFVICEQRGTRVKIERPIDIKDGSTTEELMGKYIEVLDSYTRKYPDHIIMYIYAARRRAMLGGTKFFID